MAFTSLDLGTAANDGTGDTLRDGGEIINQNFGKALPAAAQFGTTITDDANITAALHKFKYTDVNKATDVTLTVKKNEFAKGEWFVLIQTGAGQFELDCDAEVTVPSFAAVPKSKLVKAIILWLFRCSHPGS